MKEQKKYEGYLSLIIYAVTAFSILAFLWQAVGSFYA
jgi:hypothetical protein